MKRIILTAVLAIAATALWAGAASAAPAPVTLGDVLQTCQTEGGVNYITDGAFEEEADCEATDQTIADPTSDFYGHPVCIGGTTYLYSDDEGDEARASFLADLVDLGFAASDGACPAAPNVDIDHSPLCYTHYSDDVVFFDNGMLGMIVGNGGFWIPSVSKTGGGQAVQTGSPYHFVCNPPAGLKPSGTKVGDDGVTVVSDAFAATNAWWWEILG